MLSVGLPVDRFLNQGVPAAHDKILLSSFWVEWLKAGGAHPAYSQCIGYKTPLFLNGQQGVSNLELSDLDVYWYVTAQILQQVQGRG